MRLRTLAAGAALTAAAALAAPALAADMQPGATTVSPEMRQMHQEMGGDISGSEARAAAQVKGPDLLVGESPSGRKTIVITQEHAYPELFAAQVDGIASVGDEAATMRQPGDMSAPMAGTE